MNDLLKIDDTFNESMFISKVNNIMVMLHTSIMLNDLDRVRHFISDDLEKKFEDKLNMLNKKNETQMYDEFNVKSSNINDIIIKDNIVEIDVNVILRYMDYIVNKETGDFIRGNNKSRVEKSYLLKFVRIISKKYNGRTFECTNCGATLNINNTGVCPYCRKVFKAEDYDYILTDIIER